ncbi:hypothetical protein NM688_g4370 [Phlebia brevispora]|uniref:Uncharacterized protein n=1 Tax=Phlebia brevispora TaxID=194682 RepID=A0ACC1T2U9_9APHY|nr:hypothetical protein NM688_g4370 [Phlebia brevispora]
MLVVAPARRPLTSSLCFVRPDEQPQPAQDQPAPSGSKTWEIVMIIVLVALVSALVAVSMWARTRRRRKAAAKQSRRSSVEQRGSPYRGFVRFSSEQDITKEGGIQAPLPVLPYDGRNSLVTTDLVLHAGTAVHARNAAGAFLSIARKSSRTAANRAVVQHTSRCKGPAWEELLYAGGHESAKTSERT